MAHLGAASKTGRAPRTLSSLCTGWIRAVVGQVVFASSPSIRLCLCVSCRVCSESESD